MVMTMLLLLLMMMMMMLLMLTQQGGRCGEVRTNGRGAASRRSLGRARATKPRNGQVVPVRRTRGPVALAELKPAHRGALWHAPCTSNAAF